MASDDLSQTLSSLLSNPQTMQMLQGLMGALASNSSGNNNGNGSSGGSGGNDSNSSAQALQGLMGALSGGGSGGGNNSAQTLQSLMGMLGGGAQAQNTPEAPADDDTPQTPPEPAAQPDSNGGAGGLPFDPSLFLKMQQALGALRQDDPRMNFLVALKPNLSEHRRHRVDEAVRILRLLNLVPLLREQHLL